MASSKSEKEQKRKVDSILISQPKPERSPFFDIAEKWDIKVDWRSFIHVEGVTEKEFRKNRLRPDEYTAIIFTSKNSIEHFFRMCEDMRIKMDGATKYFCLTEAIANYLQKFIVYRKRKVFVGVRTPKDLDSYFKKHKDTEKFLLPCSNLGAKNVTRYLEENEIEYKEAMMYRTVSSDLSNLTDVFYDILIFYSPLGIESLYENFPDFKQGNTRLAIYGKSTKQAVLDKGLTINIYAPAPDTPSMSGAVEDYLALSNKK